MQRCQLSFRILILLVLVRAVGLSACAPAAILPTASPTPVPSDTPTATPAAPTQTFTPTATATPRPTATSTQTPTPPPTLTPSATFTPTITNTPRPVYNFPGVYDQWGKCFTHHWRLGGTNYVVFCVDSVTVQANRSMQFFVSWDLHAGGSGTKDSDSENSKMYLTDNLGNKYYVKSAGGDAAASLRFAGNSFFTGWFLFSPPAEGAISFTFHDDDMKESVPGIMLVTLVQ